jgi:hypothetical protein
MSKKSNIETLKKWIRTMPSTDTQNDGLKARVRYNVAMNGHNIKKTPAAK